MNDGTAPLFDRRVSIQVETVLVEDLRVSFKVERPGGEDPNKAQVAIFNLAPDTRARILKLASARFILSAGYPDTISQLFSGNARKPAGIQVLKSGNDVITRLQVGDGEVAYQQARFSKSYTPGTRIADVVRDLARGLGVGLGNLEDALAGGTFRQGRQTFPSGYVVHGNAGPELAKLVKGLGLNFSIQDGQLQLLRPGQTTRQTAVLLSKDTGLLDTPEYSIPEKSQQGPPTVKAKCLLQPTLIPGRLVEIRSKSVNGFFRCKAVTHSGDTHGGGGEWASECTLVAV